MPSIDWYLDAAIERASLGSDRALSHRLGLAHQGVNNWRSKRAWPSDEAMIALAELAGVEPAKALLDLNSWRAKGERSRAVYLDLAAKVLSVAVVIFVSNSSAQAAVVHENNLAVTTPVYTLCAI